MLSQKPDLTKRSDLTIAPGNPQSIPQIPGLDLEALMKFSIDPTDTQAILDVQKSMLPMPNRAEMIRWVVEAIEKCEPFKALYEEKYIPRFPTNDELVSYLEGSLGRAIGNHLVTNGIQLDFSGLDLTMFYPKDMSLLTYLSIRGIRIHDIIHATLGLGITPIDEYAVATFTMAQYRSPYHMMIVASGYTHTAFYEPHNIPLFLNSIHKFYNLGMKAEFITAYKFEDNFATPLAEVRRSLNLPEKLSLLEG